MTRNAPKTAVVIGAGPAGYSAALGLSRAGFSVTVYDQHREPPARVCGAFLSPEAVLHLEWLGVLKEVREGSAAVQAAGVFVNGESSSFTVAQKGRPGLAVPRPRLELILERQSLKEGVRIERGFRALLLKKGRSDGRPEGRRLLRLRDLERGRDTEEDADLVAAADGRFSIFRTEARAPSKGWLGFNSEFAGARQAPGDLSLHFFAGGYVGTLTYADGRTNVCGLVRSEWKERTQGDWDDVFQALLVSQRSLGSQFRGARAVSPWKGVGPLPYGRYLRKTPGIFLTGDSAGVCDPFMGEGISRALAAGPMLHAALSVQTMDKAGKEAGWRAYADAWEERFGYRSKIGSFIRLANRNNWSLDLARRWLVGSDRVRNSFLSKIHRTDPIPAGFGVV